MSGISRRSVLARVAIGIASAPIIGTSMAWSQEAGSAKPLVGSQLRDSLLRSDFGTSIVDVAKHGAIGDGTTDCWPAFKRAHDAMKDGDVLYIPPGRYALSQTFRFSRFRSAIVCQGTLVPHGEFDDFLMEIVNVRPGGDHQFLPDLGVTCVVSELKLDGLYRARGLRLAQVYNSLMHRVAVWRCRGKAIDIEYSFENVWISPLISGCIGRPAISTAAGTWTKGRAYQAGDVVEWPTPEWSATDGYRAGDVVKHKGRHHRALQDTRPRQEPGRIAAGWARVPPRLFEARRSNADSDPLRVEGLTAATGFHNPDWMEKLESEPALNIVNSVGNETVDHQYFYGLCIRHCYHQTLVNIDNRSGLRKAANIEFYGAQLHGPISEYTKRIEAQVDTAGLTALETIVRLGRSLRTKFIGCNVRSAVVDDVTLLMLGGHQRSRLVEEVLVSGSNFTGEGRGLVACHVMPSVADKRIAFTDSTIHFTNPTTCRNFVDLGGRMSSMLAHEVAPAAGAAPFAPSHFVRIADAEGRQYLVPAISLPDPSSDRKTN